MMTGHCACELMKVIATSPWIPAEWIKAHGHEPCGVWFHPDFGGRRGAVGAGVCPFADRVLRFSEATADCAFVFSTHCDQLRRASDAARGPADRRFLFNLPATWQSGTARKIIAAELKRLGDFLRGLGGQTPTPQALEHQLDKFRAARTELARAAQWCFGSAYANAIARFHRDGSFQLPRRDQDPPATSSPRLALIGGPFGSIDFPLLGHIEALGGTVVLNATETGERTLAPRGLPRSVRHECDHVERMAEELAQCLLEQCVDVFQRPNTPLYAWLEPRLAERKVQGIILWHYLGCDLWRAEAESLRETFKLPLLLLEAGESDSLSQRNLGRLQAFLEMLKP
jgi:benzoyl-CoA reductase/2-hydroxyglutaryl-CoA dehydratase subunit BcrC/BadD/HgdB